MSGSQSDAAATEIAQEIRAGLPNVAMAKWCSDDSEPGTVKCGSLVIGLKHSLPETAARDDWLRLLARLIARCSPDRLTVLLDAFDARGKEIERLQAALAKIEGGHVPNASTLAMNGNWHDFTTELQLIARDALHAKENQNG
jgi:hypothetical protein